MKPRLLLAPRLLDTMSPTTRYHLTVVRRQTCHIDEGLFDTLNQAEMRAADLMEADEWIDSGVIRLNGPLGAVASVVGSEQ